MINEKTEHIYAKEVSSFQKSKGFHLLRFNSPKTEINGEVSKKGKYSKKFGR